MPFLHIVAARSLPDYAEFEEKTVRKVSPGENVEKRQDYHRLLDLSGRMACLWQGLKPAFMTFMTFNVRFDADFNGVPAGFNGNGGFHTVLHFWTRKSRNVKKCHFRAPGT